MCLQRKGIKCGWPKPAPEPEMSLAWSLEAARKHRQQNFWRILLQMVIYKNTPHIDAPVLSGWFLNNF